MFEIFNNKLFLLAVLCFIFANCNEQKTRNRYYPIDFMFLNRNNGADSIRGGGQDKYYKFCWRWVKSVNGSNYKVVTIEKGNSDFPTDDNTRTHSSSFVYTFQLRNDLRTSGINTDHAFFQLIQVNIHGSTFEISTSSSSGHKFILASIQEVQYFNLSNWNEGDLDISPFDLVGTNNYRDQITDSTKFRSRQVVLNGNKFQVLTLEE